MMSKRKINPPIEFVLKHDFHAFGISADEYLVLAQKEILVVWKFDSSAVICAKRNAYGYIVNNDKRYFSKSLVPIFYLLSTSPSQFTNNLLKENFISKDMLSPFSKEYSPSGDPRLWKTNFFYNRNDNISLFRLFGHIVFAFRSPNEPSKAIFFDTINKEVVSISWEEGLRWIFSNHSNFSALGMFPKNMVFETNGTIQISSKIVSVKLLSQKPFSDFISFFESINKSFSINEKHDNAIRLLTSYR